MPIRTFSIRPTPVSTTCAIGATTQSAADCRRLGSLPGSGACAVSTISWKNRTATRIQRTWRSLTSGPVTARRGPRVAPSSGRRPATFAG